MRIPPVLLHISEILQTRHAKAVLVGGCVRDHFLQIPIKDYDIEVYGLKRLEELEEILAKFGKVKSVGRSFGILKLVHKGVAYDFAFPRQERKTGSGHRGFDVEVDGTLDFKTAARRRDFTINAMGYDIQSRLFLDPFGGRRDLEAKCLRHIDDETFVEDPLRVYRGIQFCARFGLQMADSTEALCRRMSETGMLEELPKERIFDEIKKLLLQSKQPSIGWELMKKLGVLVYFPPLYTLPPSLWRQTLKRLDVMAALIADTEEKEALVLMLSALCGACSSTQSETVLSFLSDEKYLHIEVRKLTNHWRQTDAIYQNRAHDPDTQIRKLSTIAPLWKLVQLARADFLASHPGQKYLAGEWVARRARMLGVLYHAPKPLLQGKDLLQMGMEPSPEFKAILDKVYQLQLEGKLYDKKEALRYIRKEVT